MVTTGNQQANVSIVPETMEAVVIDNFGPPSVLHAAQVPVPQPGPNEVLIAVHAAGVAVWDQQLRDGSWQPQANVRPPIIIGTGGAGTIAKIGQHVKSFSVGDRVFAWGYGGFYAEYVAVRSEYVGSIPPYMKFEEAAAAVDSGLTTLQGLYDILEITSGQHLLIMGASGSMGTLAIQFAHHRGTRVAATASGQGAQDLARSLGADAVVDARHSDGPAQLRAFAPGGLDAALVLGAGPSLESYLDQVRQGGRIAFPYGAEPEPRPRPGVRVNGYNLEAGGEEIARLSRLASSFQLQVPIAASFSLADAVKAHERLASGHLLGKVVLRTKLEK